MGEKRGGLLQRFNRLYRPQPDTQHTHSETSPIIQERRSDVVIEGGKIRRIPSEATIHGQAYQLYTYDGRLPHTRLSRRALREHHRQHGSQKSSAVLGAGAFGVVLRAEPMLMTNSEGHVSVEADAHSMAVKFVALHETAGASKENVEKSLLHEIEQLRQREQLVEARKIVTDSGDQAYMIAMELANGMNGARFQEYMDRLPPEERYSHRMTLVLMQSFLTHLEKLQREWEHNGTRHFDIKPANIFLNEEHPDQATFVDHGLTMTDGEMKQYMDTSGSISGTTKYLSQDAVNGVTYNRDAVALAKSYGEFFGLMQNTQSPNSLEALKQVMKGTAVDTPRPENIGDVQSYAVAVEQQFPGRYGAVQKEFGHILYLLVQPHAQSQNFSSDPYTQYMDVFDIQNAGYRHVIHAMKNIVDRESVIAEAEHAMRNVAAAEQVRDELETFMQRRGQFSTVASPVIRQWEALSSAIRSGDQERITAAIDSTEALFRKPTSERMQLLEQQRHDMYALEAEIANLRAHVERLQQQVSFHPQYMQRIAEGYALAERFMREGEREKAFHTVQSIRQAIDTIEERSLEESDHKSVRMPGLVYPAAVAA